MSNFNSYRPNEGQKRFGHRTITPTQPEWQVSRPEKARSEESEARKAQLESEIARSLRERCPMANVKGDHILYEEEEEAA